MPCPFVPLTAADRTQQPWANGRGSTTELAREARADWRWRLSIARIDTDGAFSPLAVTRRQLAPLDSDIELAFAARSVHARRLQVVCFDGEPAPHCRLPDGPTRAFNLMLRGDAGGALIARPLVGHMVLVAQPGVRWFVYLPSGEARVQAEGGQWTLAMDEAGWIRPSHGERVVIEGAGDIVLARLPSDDPPGAIERA